MKTACTMPTSALMFCVILFLSACATEPVVQQGPDAEMSYDGLAKVDHSVMSLAWVKPGLSLKAYSKILTVNAGIEYKAVKPVSRMTARTSSTNEFPLDENQKGKIAKAISEVFQSELSKVENFTLTDEPAADTVIVAGKILDVVSNVPPEPIGRSRIYLNKLGEATLVIEIRDSLSGEILARAVDRGAIGGNIPSESNIVTNTAELKIFARRWASLLRKRLDEFHSL